MYFSFCSFFIAISCGEKNSNRNDIDLKNFTEVPGKGYCVKKYDEKGCNTCSLVDGQGWICNFLYCSKTDEDEEKANQCTEYLSKEELLKKIKQWQNKMAR